MIGDLEILECLDDATLVVDSGNIVAASNAPARALFSLDKSAIVGRTLDSLVVPCEATLSLEEVVRTIGEQRSWQCDVRLKHVTCADLGIGVTLRIKPLLLKERSFDGALCIFREVGQQTRASRPESVDAALSEGGLHEVESLLQGANLVPLVGSFETAARTIYEICKHAIGAKAGYVALASEDRQTNDVLFLDAGDLNCTVDPDLPMPIRGLRGEAYTLAEVVYDNHFERSDWRRYLPSGHVRLENVMMAPISIRGDVIGVIGLSNKPGGFSEGDKRLAEAFGDLAAIAWRSVNDRQATERLAMAIEQSSEIVIITDPDGVITYTNPAFEVIAGYSSEEAIGRSPLDFNSDEDAVASYEEAWKTVTSGKTWKGRLVNKRKDGRVVIVDATISPIREPSGDIVNYVVVSRDITNELELWEQLLHSQKMEAIGLIAGGVAHDINNILATILVTRSALASKLGENSSEHEELDVISDACHRGGDLTQNLLRFSGKGASLKEAFSPNDVVSQTVRLIERSFLKKLRITMKLEDDLPLIWGDRSQISQTMMNLFINAADAMVGYGELTISTRTIGSKTVSTTVGGLPGQSVQVIVADTGVGMATETLHHVFEPFYTTKPPGKGTGLGLSMAYGTVKSHRGSVDIESRIGEGTTVTLAFPAYDVCGPREELTTRPSKTTSIGGGILLVDDEEDMLFALAKFLRSSVGYEVFTTCSGRDAIDIFLDVRDRVSLVILDMIMPDMNGEEVFYKLQQIDPTVKVIITSGYAEDEMVERLVMSGVVDFIKKPFDLEQLMESIALHMKDYRRRV